MSNQDKPTINLLIAVREQLAVMAHLRLASDCEVVRTYTNFEQRIIELETIKQAASDLIFSMNDIKYWNSELFFLNKDNLEKLLNKEIQD